MGLIFIKLFLLCVKKQIWPIYLLHILMNSILHFDARSVFFSPKGEDLINDGSLLKEKISMTFDVNTLRFEVKCLFKSQFKSKRLNTQAWTTMRLANAVKLRLQCFRFDDFNDLEIFDFQRLARLPWCQQQSTKSTVAWCPAVVVNSKTIQTSAPCGLREGLW